MHRISNIYIDIIYIILFLLTNKCVFFLIIKNEILQSFAIALTLHFIVNYSVKFRVLCTISAKGLFS